MKKIFTIIYLFYPSVLVFLYCILAYYSNTSEAMIFVLVYLITIVAVVFFFKYNLCRFKALVSGFFLSPLSPLIIAIRELLLYTNKADGLYAAIWQYAFIFVIACMVYYVLPFIIISIIIKKCKH